MNNKTIDMKLDAAYGGVKFVRTLSTKQVNDYLKSLNERKAAYDFDGQKSGWTAIYDGEGKYCTEVVKLARRYKLFMSAISDIKKSKGPKAKPLDKACNAYDKLTHAEKKSFMKLNKLKAA